jgi:ribosomal protein S10
MWYLLRRITLVGVAMLTIATLSASTPEGAEIELSTAIIDLGTISQEDGKQMVRLSYTNTGDLPLVVTEVRTSCSCTTVDYERKKILPTERGTITITMNPAKAPKGQYLRVMQIFSTAKSGTKRVTIKAVIE